MINEIDTNEEVKVSIPIGMVKNIFLCLCDAAERLDYVGIGQVYSMAHELRKWVDSEETNVVDPVCSSAWRQLVHGIKQLTEVAKKES